MLINNNEKLIFEILKSEVNMNTITSINSILKLNDFGFQNSNAFYFILGNFKIILYFIYKGNKFSSITFINIKNNKSYKSNLKYNNYFELISDINRLNINFEFNNGFNYNKLFVEFNSKTLLKPLIKKNSILDNSFVIKKISNHINVLYLDNKDICIINHRKKRVYFIDEINVIDDFQKILYDFICKKIVKYNLDLNYIRNDLHKFILDEKSLIILDNLILKFQYFSNNFYAD